MLKHFLYALIYIRIIIVNYIVNLILKKNRKNTSKHSDASGIYARTCLQACESKLSRPHHLLCAIASDTVLLREKNRASPIPPQ